MPTPHTQPDPHKALPDEKEKSDEKNAAKGKNPAPVPNHNPAAGSGTFPEAPEGLAPGKDPLPPASPLHGQPAAKKAGPRPTHTIKHKGHSRTVVDDEGRATGVETFNEGDRIAPTEQELEQFADRFEPIGPGRPPKDDSDQ